MLRNIDVKVASESSIPIAEVFFLCCIQSVKHGNKNFCILPVCYLFIKKHELTANWVSFHSVRAPRKKSASMDVENGIKEKLSPAGPSLYWEMAK